MAHLFSHLLEPIAIPRRSLGTRSRGPQAPYAFWLGLLVCLLMVAPPAGWAQSTTAPSGLSLEQESLKNRFERLEGVATRLAELAATSEPERAEQLRRTIRASREKGIAEHFATIVRLLDEERLSAAAHDQEQLQAQLEALLQVLLEDPNASERNAMRKFLKEQLREIGKVIRLQRSLRGKTLEGEDLEGLAEQQEEITDSTQKIEQQLDLKKGSTQPSPSESQPGETPTEEPPPGEPGGKGDSQGDQQSEESPQESADPIERAAQRVERARKAMEQAEQKLRDTQRDEAREEQQAAQRALEEARAELERVLRQMREEEMEKLLARLASRFRDMLAEQRVIYEETVDVYKETRQGDNRNLMLRAIRLSRREVELIREAEKAQTMLREDGTSVAFPETVQQIASDMQAVATRLAAADVGAITQTIELDIIAGLEDMIGALDMARDEVAQQRSQPSGGAPQGGAPDESPLVSKLAELRMIRTLQARVLRRTQSLGALTESPEVNPQELAGQLQELARRQAKIFQATRDLETDANR